MNILNRLLYCLLLGQYVLVSAQPGVPERLDSLFHRQLSVFPQEKIHLHTDKPFYIGGDTIWFRAYLVDAVSHVPFPASRYVYVELFNPLDTLVIRVKIRKDDDAYYGYLAVPESLPEGDYTLRAYTYFMRSLDEQYFYTQTVRIGNTKNRLLCALPSPDNGFDVSFFPEGGALLQGVVCRVAFKASKSNGQPANVEGLVFDRSGTEVGQIKTDYMGMGSFMLLPNRGTTYHAVCTGDNGQTKRFELPAALEEGNVLSVNTSQKYIHVSVRKPVSDSRDNALYLLAHTRGIVQFVIQWDKDRSDIHLPVTQFPSGILHFVLFDTEMNPVSERFAFVHNDDQAQVSFESDLNGFAARTLVNNRITLSDENGQPLMGSFSVSVTADQAVTVDSTANILTRLLLTSDLSGNIENPAAYFKYDNRSAFALNLLMLTQRWRRYEVDKVAQGQLAHPTTALELGPEISGRVRRLLVDQPVEKQLVTIASSNGDYFDVAETDSQGRFNFSIAEQPDSALFMVHINPKSGNQALQLLVDGETFPERTDHVPDEAVVDEKSFEQYVSKAEKAKKVSGEGDYAWDIDLQEVTVAAKKPLPKSVFRDSYLIDEEEIKMHPKGNGILSLLESVSGISIGKDQFGRNGKELQEALNDEIFRKMPDLPKPSPPYPYYQAFENDKFVMYHNDLIERLIIDDQINPSLVFINNQSKFAYNDIVFDYIKSINVENVTKIYISEVFGGGKGNFNSETGRFLLPDPPPVTHLVVICKDINNIFTEQIYHHIKSVQPLGYQTPATFNAPKYDIPEAKSKKTADLRTTIHWQPVVQTDSLGVASFQFYTADEPTSYTCIIEGITDNGRIIRNVRKFNK